MTPVLRVEGITKHFPGVLANDHVDFDLYPGEIHALLGENGAGKTTLMNILATLSRPTAGDVRVAGLDAATDATRLRGQIGLVSHKALLYDDLSARQNLYFYARLYEVTQPEARIELLLRQVGLWVRQHDLVRTFSRGMQQRLAIARALLHDPPVVLLDEPDTGLDQHGAARLYDWLHQSGAAQRTVIMTTHNLERGLQWGDRIAILAQGRIAFQAARAELDIAGLRARYDQLVGEA